MNEAKPIIFVGAIDGYRFAQPILRAAGYPAGGVELSRWPRRRDWLSMAAHAKFDAMETSSTSGLPKEFFSELERKFFWWEPVCSQPRSDARILAQAMSMAGFEEVRRLEQMLGYDRLVETMLQAEPGWIDERSWEFWRGRLIRATGRRMPDAAPLRSFDAGSV